MGIVANLKEYSAKLYKTGGSHQNHNIELDLDYLKLNIVREVGQEVFDYVSKYVDLTESDSFITATTTKFNIDNLPNSSYYHIVNLKKINDTRFINKFFEAVNSKLELGGLY